MRADRAYAIARGSWRGDPWPHWLDLPPTTRVMIEKSMAAMQTRIDDLETAARDVCDYDFSDSDADVIDKIGKLRKIVA